MGEISRKLDMLIKMVMRIQRKEFAMSKEMDSLTDQVKKNTDAEASAVVLIQGLATQIASLKNDPVALLQLSDQLKASADALGAAVVANTAEA